jgi:hypothetical protein
MASDLWRCRNKKCCDDSERVRANTDGTYGTHGTYVNAVYEKEALGIYLAARELPGIAVL